MRSLIVFWFALLASTSLCAADEQPSPPNIVILFADDLGYGDLGSYGHPYNRTPNLDRLASEGQRWTDFYMAAPVCSPSRGALLTGRLPVRTGLYGRRIRVLFPDDSVGIPDTELTMAEALRGAGYATAIIGKWHLGDAPATYPTRHGFDYWYGIPYSNDMDWVGQLGIDELLSLRAQGQAEQVSEALAGRKEKYFDPKVEYWNVPVLRSKRTSDGFVDEVIERPAQQTEITKQYTEEAVAFIKRSKSSPFLLYVPYSMPHTPIFRSEAFAGKSLGGRYGDVIEELDWSVGEIVDALADAGLTDNTLVVFTSDNGPWLTMNQHGGTAGLLRHGKGTTFEGGVRVPTIFYWPGQIRPAVVSDIGSAMDLYATALSLAGAEIPQPTDGLNIAETLLEGTTSHRNSVAYYREGELYAFRQGEFKLHLITSGVYGQPPEKVEHERPVLYHLPSDPSEKFDVSAEFPEVVEEIQDTIAQHQAGLSAQPPLFDSRLHRIAH